MAQTQLNGRVIFEDNDDYNAVDLRKLVQDSQLGAGVDGYNSLLPGVVSGLTMSFTPGAGFVRQPGDGSIYRCTQEGTNATIALDANPSGNPRIDQLVLHVYDASAAGDSSGQFLAAIENVTGTPTSGATLDNRSGAPDLQTALTTSKAYILLADVLMPAGASTVSAGNVRDRRPFSGMTVPPLNAASLSAALADVVPLNVFAGNRLNRYQTDSGVASNQAAALMWNPRKIKATKVRWQYIQGGVSGDALGSTSVNWRIVVCDASGRLVGDTGTVAFSGAAADPIFVNATMSVPYTGYIFDVGPLYVWFGVGNIPATKGVYYRGICAGGVFGGNPAPGDTPASYNEFVWSGSGGTTFPAAGHIKGMTDVLVSGMKSVLLPVPAIALAT